MIRKIANLDNHHLRIFFANTDQLSFLIKLYIDFNIFFPAQVVYMLRDYFFLRFEFYYNSFSYFVSLIVSVWRISDLSFKNIDEFIFFKYVLYNDPKLYSLSKVHNLLAPKMNPKFPLRFIFLLLQHTLQDYRIWFKHGIYRFRFQKFFKITTEYNIVFREYHSKYRDELFFEKIFESPFRLTKIIQTAENIIINTGIIYNNKFDTFLLLKKRSLNYLKQSIFLIFIKIRNFLNLLFQTFIPLIGVFFLYEWQLKFLFFISLLIRTKSLIDSIFLYKQKYVSGMREPRLLLVEKKLKRWLSWETFLLFRFIVHESSSRNFQRRYKKVKKIVKIIINYRFIKKTVIWNFKIFKRMFNFFFWFYFTLHLIDCVDYFIEFHFITEERVFFLIYEYLKRKYKEIYDFFFTFY